MIYQVTVYKPDGTIKRVVSQTTLMRRHWREFWKLEKTQVFGSTIGRGYSKENLETQKHLGFEKFCDTLNYDHGVGA